MTRPYGQVAKAYLPTFTVLLVLGFTVCGFIIWASW